LLWNTAQVKAILLRLGKNPLPSSSFPMLQPFAGTHQSVSLLGN
jgi:hypothetical protein